MCVVITAAIVGCAPQTEEDKINAINRRISPEGHLTAQYLFVDWPALYSGNNQVAEPLKLKIPIEYLVPGLSLQKKSSVEYVEDSLSLSGNHINMISLRLLPDAKPFTPIIGNQSSSPEETQKLAEYFRKSYSLNIMRDEYFINRDIKPKTNQLVIIDAYGTHMKEGSIAGLNRYVNVECFDIDRGENQIQDTDNPIEFQKIISRLDSKAKDDHSPENCYEHRGLQYLVPLSEGVLSKSVLSIYCSSTGCNGYLGLNNRLVIINVSKENTMYQYEGNMARSPENLKVVLAAKAQNKPVEIKPFQQPMLNEIFTDLPNWDKKIIPASNLLNSFVVKQSAPVSVE
jgi:hypothetical protein